MSEPEATPDAGEAAEPNLVLHTLLPELYAAHHAARSEHGHYASFHEGYAVMLEEVDELWREVKRKHIAPKRIYEEARDVAVACLEIMVLAVQAQRAKGK